MSGSAPESPRLSQTLYRELRALAAARLRREGSDCTIEATALVHEAFLKLQIGTSEQTADTVPEHIDDPRAYFFAAAAEAMRRILVDAARKRNALRCGGKMQRQTLDDDRITVPVTDERLLEIHDAVDRLEQQDRMAAQLVKLRFFAGFTTTECADALSLPVRTAHEVWTFARAWLKRDLTPD